jgi:hypothetical protein
MKRALRLASWIYSAGMVVMAASLLIFSYRAPWMHGLSAGLLARFAALIFLWPVVLVIFILMWLGHVTLE